MSEFGLSFHHLGLAVKKEDDALIFLGGLGYEAGKQVYDELQNVHLRLCTLQDSPSVELVTPGHGPGPLTPIFKRHNELIYHTCYETDDREASLVAFENSGLRVLAVVEPKPAILFGGREVSFHTVLGFGLVELLTT